MISIDEVVRIFFWLLVVGLIFGIMFGVTYYIAREYPATEPWMRGVRIVLVILAAFVAIGFLLALLGHPIVRY